jgi:diguanylate cyclase (GGDEF)-like protein/PAS domain S-box-containing protein
VQSGSDPVTTDEQLPPNGLLHELLDLAPVAILTLDPQGAITSVAGHSLVFPAEHMLGRSVLDLAEGERQRADVQRVLDGESLDLLEEWGGRSWDSRWRASLGPGGEVTGVVAIFIDVTERMAAERALAEREAFLSAVISAAHEALVVVDLKGCVQIANEQFGRLFGRSIRPGTSLLDLLPGPMGDQLRRQLVERAAGEEGRYELHLPTAPGGEVWVLVSASPLRGAAGEVLGSVALLTDITANKHAEQLLRTESRTDPLTGLGNRTVLTDRLDHALERRDAGTLAVLFCDMDGLKHFNDRYGHATGDAALRLVGQRIAHAVRPEDTVTRFGGDEFVVLCETLHDPQEAGVLAERIRAALRTDGDELPEPVTVSIGIATTATSSDAETLLADADAAVYAAKRAGRDRVRSG